MQILWPFLVSTAVLCSPIFTEDAPHSLRSNSLEEGIGLAESRIQSRGLPMWEPPPEPREPDKEDLRRWIAGLKLEKNAGANAGQQRNSLREWYDGAATRCVASGAVDEGIRLWHEEKFGHTWAFRQLDALYLSMDS
ncbi:hypothetical protein F4778DRAFT_785023 [Xylariomycetidae sp. FL2044]|nr:hypothetical protein F4778DRAFT_785023 [Xylariomycetidae sp. FL2044]